MSGPGICHDCGTRRLAAALVAARRYGEDAAVCRDRGACLERRQERAGQVAGTLRKAGAPELPGMEG